jgi:NAD(P)-dependent dehydrogenase (short-subunit alcohol dehydrogenase family)
MADIPTPTSLAGMTALVTGGGRGLGAAICQELAGDGANVLVADIDLASAQAVADRLGDHAEAIGLDVGDDAQVAAAIDHAVARFGRLDVMVNNAAIDVTLPVEELQVADWDRVLRTNLTGPFLLSRRAAMAMRAAPGDPDRAARGHIVNIVSTAARRAWPNASVYHATKWGLLGLSHALHAELRPHGIKVTAIIAGGMRTAFLLDRFPDIDVENLQEPANVARTVRFALLQPPGTVIPELMVLPMRETSWP